MKKINARTVSELTNDMIVSGVIFFVVLVVYSRKEELSVLLVSLVTLFGISFISAHLKFWSGAEDSSVLGRSLFMISVSVLAVLPAIIEFASLGLVN